MKKILLDENIPRRFGPLVRVSQVLLGDPIQLVWMVKMMES